MRYFLVAGEASGDLHASHLMRALLEQDPEAEFRCYGGDQMQAAGGMLLCHYRELAYMGFIPVLLHARTILHGLAACKRAIAEWRPDAVILIDYPGFNLKVARFVRAQGICPVYYYIAPKIWAWKEYRIKSIRRDVDRLFSILPFEVAFFEGKHHYPISYVGNPTLDEVEQFLRTPPMDYEAYLQQQGMPPSTPCITLLPGSRVQEIRDNLYRMLRAVAPRAEAGALVVVCAAPGVPDALYRSVMERAGVPARVERGRTYEFLRHSTAALVTSGTATLETALLGVPQVVCYYMRFGRLMNFLRRRFLKVPYISLVNLICGREVVPELIGEKMNEAGVRRSLDEVLARREAMLRDYADLRGRLGRPGAPRQAAAEMVERLRGRG